MIALLLMAFMVVLLLSLSSMTQVQMQTAGTETQMKQARSNALFGLQVALARLNELALDDTVATASASMFVGSGTASGSGLPSSVDDSKQHWIGVWDSSESAWSPLAPNNRTFKGWLASNNDYTDVDAVSSELSDSVILMETDIGGGGTTGNVEAEVVKMDSAGTNAYAFWIADESLKASMGLADPWGEDSSTSNTASANAFRRSASQKNNQAKAPGLSSGKFDNNEWRVAAPKILTFESLANATTGDISVEKTQWESLINNNRHDFTLNSYGLLTNPRGSKNSWKKDLSLAFSSDVPFAELVAFNTETTKGGARVFDKEDFASYPGYSTSRGFFGPRWEALRDYHEKWRLFGTNPSPDYTANVRTDSPKIRLPSDPGRTSVHFEYLNEGDYTNAMTLYAKVINANIDDVVADIGSKLVRGTASTDGDEIVSSPMGVVITYFAVVYRFSVSDAGRLQFGYYPVVQLWNPHNVELELPSALTTTFRITFSPIFNLDLVSPSSETIFIKTSRTRLTSFTVQQLHESGSTTETAFRFPAFKLAPGEILSFSLDGPTSTTQAASGTGDSHYITRPMETRWDRDGEFLFKDSHFIAQIEDASDPSGYKDLILNDTDRIRFRVRIPASHTGTSTSPRRARFSSNTSGGDSKRPGFFEKLFIPSKHTTSPIYDQIVTVGTFRNEPLETVTIEGYVKPGDEFPNAISQYNPASIFRGHNNEMVDGERSNPPDFHFDIRDVGGGYNPPVNAGSSRTQGQWGSDIYSGSSTIILYDIPRAPLHSLGQLQNANISLFESRPAYAIGNSYAPARIPKQQIINTDDDRIQIDYSWMLNHKLWDDYFFSAIPLKGSAHPITGETVDDTYLKSGKPLPNSRYAVTLSGDDTGRLYDSIDTVASELTVQGAFNVNSTSVNAWKAVLGSLPQRRFNMPSGPEATPSELNSAFYRHSTPYAKAGEAWTAGWSQLDDGKLTELAEKIVDEIKKRGPSMGLSDFVNRRLENSEFGDTGILQAAIDANPVTNSSSAMLMEPGTLSQGDILSAIGPFLTTRGDTFLIRAYGSVSTPSADSPSAEAWIEAVVRRTPDKSNINNIETGRTFVIDSIRWLAEDEL